LPFVENSFKHALKNVRGTVQIVINIQASGNRAMLMVENDHISGNGNGNGQGTGISNIRRQLELLYDNNYSLHISDDDNKYRVSLTIPVK
jgi:LytS/YehU family sensor histidine kinase